MKNTMEKLKIEMIDGDYYDSEKHCFVINYNGRGAKFAADAEIKDLDGIVWDCYLTNVKFYPRDDSYTAEYKAY